MNTTHKGRIGITVAVFLIAFAMASYAEAINYMYDEVNRLKRVETGGGTTAEYSYDGAGNRLQIQGPDLVPPVTTASPLGGIYNTNQSVTLTCNDASGAGCSRIYYTTNGTTPTTASAVYSTPISISATTTVKYFGRDRDGNSEAVKTQVYTIDKTPPTGSFVINSGSMGTNNVNVTLSLSCSDANGCTHMQFSNNNSTYSNPEPYDTTKIWTLTTGDGYKCVSAKFRDAAANWSNPCKKCIHFCTMIPTGSLAINSGSAFTNNATVTLNMSCKLTCSSGFCHHARFSNDNVTYSPLTDFPNFLYSWSLKAYLFSRSWMLTPGDGVKTVYVQLFDSLGNGSVMYSASITLDTVRPTTTAAPTGGAYTGAQAVALICDDGAGSGCDKIYYTTNGTAPTTSSAVYSTPISIIATTTVKYFAKDRAGNSEAVKSQTYTISAP